MREGVKGGKKQVTHQVPLSAEGGKKKKREETAPTSRRAKKEEREMITIENFNG